MTSVNPGNTGLSNTGPNRIQRLAKLYHGLILSTIGFGILVRLWQYFSDRSLWADEAAIAYNIVHRSYGQLLQPLLRNQAAPVGFLWIEKLSVQLFGDDELALRLFPLIAGIGAIFLFYSVIQRYLKPTGIIIGLMLFCSSKELIDYSSEVKQYSSDVAIALLCFLLVSSLMKAVEQRRTGQIIGLVFSGAVLIWFSHPAIFSLLGLGVGAMILQWRSALGRSVATRMLLVLSSWLFSFLAFYWFSLRNISSSDALNTYWQEQLAFPDGLFDIHWLVQTWVTFFAMPLGWQVPLNGLAIVLFVVGCFALIQRNHLLLPFLLAPAIATLLATYLHKYPFQGRLVLFLGPFVLIIIAAGAAELWLWQTHWNRRFVTLNRAILGEREPLRRPLSPKIAQVVSLFLILTVTGTSLYQSGQILVQPILKEEIKPVLNYIKTHRQPADQIYVFQRVMWQFQYYAPQYGYRRRDYMTGVDNLGSTSDVEFPPMEYQRYLMHLKKLSGKQRVWFIFAQSERRKERPIVRAKLDAMGKKIDEFRAIGVSVSLYDLRSIP